MKANPSPMSVADYCHDFNNKKIVVNDEYQRNEGVWTSPAKSFFIESILLEYPIPKIYLYARLDLKSRQTVKEIVDGQQRTQSLVGFFNGKLRLSKNIDTEELRGLKYQQLDDEWKTKFLSYSLPIDQFAGVPEDEVREAFRRMNANNVPLNDEEQRNARFQGLFKWFIIGISEKYNQGLYRIGLFSKRDLIRMSDLKLYADITYTLDNSFQTIKAKQLDDIYKKYNASFDREDEFKQRISSGLDFFLEREYLHNDIFLRSHLFQTIVLAAIALQYGGGFAEDAERAQPELAHKLAANPLSLEVLANAIRDPEAYPEMFDFIQASTQKTNVAATRITRFLYFRAALAIAIEA